MYNGCDIEFNKVLGIGHRKHHCRSCGKIFCGKHCYKKILLPDFGYSGLQRVCNICYNMHTASESNDSFSLNINSRDSCSSVTSNPSNINCIYII